jgi:hypothetical protein
MTTEMTKKWLIIAKRLDKKIRLHKKRMDAENTIDSGSMATCESCMKYHTEKGRVDGLVIAQGIVADAIGVD